MKQRGILIAEAIVASFLMLFAFVASASLFDAALRWEADSGNYRKAALVAERKMEELRAASADIAVGEAFADQIDALIAADHDEYDDAPGFAITVTALPNTHRVIPANGLTPTDGVHSPCSSFFTAPGPAGAPHSFDNRGDHQINRVYHTYPYSRPMPRSFRLVQVTVEYGGGVNPRTFELVSLIGDPLLVPTTTGSGPVKVTRVGSNSDLNSSNPNATFNQNLQTQSGAIVEEVSAIWNITPTSTGAGKLFTPNPNGTSCRLDRRTPAFADTEITLAARVRYRGVEYVGYSPTVDVQP